MHQVNTNFEHLTSIAISSNSALGLNKNEEIMEWKSDRGLKRKRTDYSYLLMKPIFKFHKMKFTKIVMNSSMTTAIDSKIFQ